MTYTTKQAYIEQWLKDNKQLITKDNGKRKTIKQIFAILSAVQTPFKVSYGTLVRALEPKK